MYQSPTWEVDRSSASQEIPRILWNPKVHHRIHNIPPHVPILSQIDPVPDFYASWRPILVLFSHLGCGLASSLFPSGLPTNTLYAPHLSSIRATCPAYLILLDFMIGIVFGE